MLEREREREGGKGEKAGEGRERKRERRVSPDSVLVIRCLFVYIKLTDTDGLSVSIQMRRE